MHTRAAFCCCAKKRLGKMRKANGSKAMPLQMAAGTSTANLMVISRPGRRNTFSSFQKNEKTTLRHPGFGCSYRGAMARAKPLCGAVAETGKERWRAGEEDKPCVTGD